MTSCLDSCKLPFAGLKCFFQLVAGIAGIHLQLQKEMGSWAHRAASSGINLLEEQPRPPCVPPNMDYILQIGMSVGKPRAFSPDIAGAWP